MTTPVSLPVVDRRGLDNSVLSTHGRCPRLAFYNYRACRTSRSENYPINFGNVYHDFREAIETFYREWIINEESPFDEARQELIYNTALATATKDWEDPPLEHRKSYLDMTRIRATCEEAFEGWVEEKKLGHYKIIGSETAFQLELPLRLCHVCFLWSDGDTCDTCGEPTHTEYFTGKIDQIIEWNRRLWVRDWKTTGMKQQWDKVYNPDHQFTGYAWAAAQLSGRKIDGVIVDIVYNIKTKGPEFHPTIANRNANDIAQWFEWVYYELANYRRSEATGIWPMRTAACGDYGGCYFRECCSRGSWPSIEHWLTQNTIHSVWDPLDPSLETGLPE